MADYSKLSKKLDEEEAQLDEDELEYQREQYRKEQDRLRAWHHSRVL